MKRLIVNGGRPLVGEVTVSGSKNAALPILFSTLAVRGVSKIKNVPDIGDVRITLKILSSMGARITRRGNSLTVDTTSASYSTPLASDTSMIRASTYLIGACLGGFGLCDIVSFGGCNFARRPIDMHLYAAERFGAQIEERVVRCARLRGGEVRFDKRSVGATVNALIMASAADGRSRIFNYAEEPHIHDLIRFLVSCGAMIDIRPEYILVEGAELHGGEVTVGGDMIEAGSYAAFALATGGDVLIRGVPDSELSSVESVVISSGGGVRHESDGVRFFGRVKGPFELLAAPYPGFPTDLQPIYSTLMAVGMGGAYVDTVFPERCSHLSLLSSFGVNFYKVLDRIIIPKAHQTNPITVEAPDLRGGAACMLAALYVRGESVIYGFDRVLRGYERPCEKLSALGADVRLA